MAETITRLTSPHYCSGANDTAKMPCPVPATHVVEQQIPRGNHTFTHRRWYCDGHLAARRKLSEQVSNDGGGA